MSKYVYKKPHLWILASLFDSLGSIFISNQKPLLETLKGKKILLSRIDHLGDALLLKPIIHDVITKHRSTKFSLLIAQEYASLFQDTPNLEIISYEHHWFSRSSFLKKLKAFFAMERTIKKNNYHIAIDFRGDVRANLLFYLAGVHTRVGYGITGGGFLLTHQGSYSFESHQVFLNQQLLNLIGIDSSAHRDCSLAFSDKEIASFQEKFKNATKKDYMILHLGSGNPEKVWPFEKFQQLIQLISNAHSETSIILVGLLSEASRKVRADNVIDLRGTTNLRELAFLLSKAKVFVGNDSGPAHLAALQHCPIVLIPSGTNDIQSWKPWTDKIDIINDKSQNPLRDTTPKQVFEALCRTVDSKMGSRA